MNKIIMMGRLTRDPEIRYGGVNNDKAVARYTIAVDRRFKQEEQPQADFFNVVSFGKAAEFVEKYLRKGAKVNCKITTTPIKMAKRSIPYRL